MGAGAHADVFGEILPAHDAGAVDEEFGWTGDVVAVGSGCDVHQIVAADNVQIGIREKGEAVASLAAQGRGDLRRVNADGDGTNAERLEFLKLLLDASQLEETEGSPVATIENQEDRLGLSAVRRRRKQLRKGSGLSGAVGEGEVGKALPDLRCAGGFGNVSGVSEEEDVSREKQERKDGDHGTPDFAAVGRRLAEGTQQSDDEIEQTNRRYQEVDPREKVGYRWGQAQEINELRGDTEQREEQTIPEG